MTRELVLRFDIREAPPISETPDAGWIRLALQSKGFSRLKLVGVAVLGMATDHLELSLEPDVEFLIIFARSIEAASRQMTSTPDVYLDDGILELSASFAPAGAWSRMGYLSDARKVELDRSKLLAIWRTFYESVLRAADPSTARKA